MDINLKVALISAIVSIGIWILSIFFDPVKEKITYVYKLKTEHKYEQKKEIKNVLAKYKMQLINTTDALNHRLLNLHDNYKWLDVKGEYDSYYFKSFLYRLLSFFAWIRKAENEMIYLDTSIATKEDVIFIKFLNLFQKIFYEARLLVETDSDYDVFFEVDHFFTDNFRSICEKLLTDDNDSVCTYEEFVTPDTSLNSYLDGLNPTEKRYRWDILQLLHYLSIAFLNTYGYDFQYTNENQINDLISKKTTKSKLNKSFLRLLDDYKLSNQKELRKILKRL